MHDFLLYLFPDAYTFTQSEFKKKQQKRTCFSPKAKLIFGIWYKVFQFKDKKKRIFFLYPTILKPKGSVPNCFFNVYLYILLHIDRFVTMARLRYATFYQKFIKSRVIFS